MRNPERKNITDFRILIEQIEEDEVEAFFECYLSENNNTYPIHKGMSPLLRELFTGINSGHYNADEVYDFMTMPEEDYFRKYFGKVINPYNPTGIDIDDPDIKNVEDLMNAVKRDLVDSGFTKEIKATARELGSNV